MEDVTKLETRELPYTAFYQTDQTKKLDSVFGLKGTQLPDKVAELQKPCFELDEPVYILKTMGVFASVAALAGNFVGLPEKEVPKIQELISAEDLEATVTAGFLERFEHEGVIVVSPTIKYLFRNAGD